MGIAFYFSLKAEPSLYIAFLTVLIFVSALSGAYLYRHIKQEDNFFRIPLFVLFFIAFGFFIMCWRTSALDTKLLSQDIKYVELVGEVLSAQADEKESVKKVILKIDVPLSEEKWRDILPKRVSLTIRKAEDVHKGAVIRALANLRAPSGPFYLGGFSFQRKAYFDGIGANGFVYGTPEILEQKPLTKVAILKEQMTDMVYSVLPKSEGAVVAALLTGQRDAISEENWHYLRASGLAHMLAISGLHVGLFAGTVFFFVRLFMVCIPNAALYLPVKKIAAFIAIFAAIGYTLFVGAGIPAVRAMMMTSLALIAIMFDRSPFSLRLVSVAAFFILLYRPESLISISFQMSFAAVTGLIIFYDRMRAQISQWYSHASFLRKAFLYVAGVMATTVIATLSTLPLTLYYFHALPTYTILANIQAMPILSFIVMPSAVLVFVGMLFDIAHYPIWIMGKGVEIILLIAKETTELPFSQIFVPAIGLLLLFCIMICVLGILILKKLTLIFPLGALAICLLATWILPKPSFLLSDDGKLLGYYNGKSLSVSDKLSARFARQIWVENLGLTLNDIETFPKSGCKGAICCSEDMCLIDDDQIKLAFLKNRYALSEICQDDKIDYIISRFSLNAKNCSARILDSRYREGKGHLFLYSRAKDVQIERTSGLYERPWTSK